MFGSSQVMVGDGNPAAAHSSLAFSDCPSVPVISSGSVENVGTPAEITNTYKNKQTNKHDHSGDS